MHKKEDQRHERYRNIERFLGQKIHEHYSSPFHRFRLGVSRPAQHRLWQMLFLIEGGIAFLFGFIIPFWLADWPKEVRWLSEDEKKVLAEQYEREDQIKSSAKNYTVWEALRDKEVLKLCLIYFMWITGFWGFGFWMPTILKSVSGWSNASIGWL